MCGDRPGDMIKYAMAKTAKEEFGETMRKRAPLYVTVERSPRLLAGQTTPIVGTQPDYTRARPLSVARNVRSWSPQSAVRDYARAKTKETKCDSQSNGGRGFSLL